MADALASGARARKGVQVQVLFPAPSINTMKVTYYGWLLLYLCLKGPVNTDCEVLMPVTLKPRGIERPAQNGDNF